MNIYEKLTNARLDLQNLKLKKSGKNQTISYYELGDFLPAINELCKKHGLFIKFDIDTVESIEMAILTVYNASQEAENMTFRLPTANVSLPRGQDIQGLGAKTTYMRRYILMNAFEIVESDMVDSIKRDLTDDVEVGDVAKIRSAKTMQDLAKICGELKHIYKLSLIAPLYDEMKTKLSQDESKA